MIKRLVTLVLCVWIVLDVGLPAYAQSDTPTPTPAPGIAIFHFLVDDQGWVAQNYGNPFPYGNYDAGAGWTFGCNYVGNTYVETDIQYAFSVGFTVTGIDVLFDRTAGFFSTPLTDGIYHDDFSIVGNRFLLQSSTVAGSGTNLHLTWTGSQVLSSGTLGVEIASAYDTAAANHCSTITTGTMHIKEIEVAGYGIPFPTITPTPTNTAVPSATTPLQWLATVDSRPFCPTWTPTSGPTPTRYQIVKVEIPTKVLSGTSTPGSGTSTAAAPTIPVATIPYYQIGTGTPFTATPADTATITPTVNPSESPTATTDPTDCRPLGPRNPPGTYAPVVDFTPPTVGEFSCDQLIDEISFSLGGFYILSFYVPVIPVHVRGWVLCTKELTFDVKIMGVDYVPILVLMIGLRFLYWFIKWFAMSI